METRQRLTWKNATLPETEAPPLESMRVASRDVEAATGLYGFTKSIQGAVEVATRKLSKRALTVARMAYEKDADVVGFLHAHATRGESRTAGILLNAMKELGPKIPEILASSKGRKSAGAAERGLYGYKSKTAELGVRACGDLRLAAGEIAAELHTRKGDMHPMITGYLQKHATKGKCGYAGMLYGCYPDAAAEAPAKPAVKRVAAQAPPTTVAGWLRLRPTE